MKTPTSLIMLLVLVGVPAIAGAADKDAPGSEAGVDTSGWQCKFCAFETGNSGYVDAGIGYLSQDSFKFGEYTGLTDKGPYVIGDALYGYRDKNGRYLDLDARNLGLESRSLDLQGGKQGKYELFLNYQELPHFISDSANTIFNGSGSDNLTLPPGWVRAPSIGGMTALSGSLQQEDLKTKREIIGLGARFFPGSKWQTTIKGRHETKEGTRATAGSFFFSSSQFVKPIDYVTDELDVSATYSGQRLQARFAYYGSMFSNSDNSLTWQNPYTSAQGADAGQLALPPDNSFNQLLASIGYQINKKTRLTADLAVGRGEQNEDFLPYTINPTVAGVQPLPRSSLDGVVETINATIKINSALTERWQFNAAYKYNDRDNQTPQATYNYVETDSALAPVPATNLPYSFTTNTLNLSGDYRLRKNAKASLGFDYNAIERTFQEVEETRDSTLWGKISAMAQDNVNVVLQAAYGDRSISNYAAVPEIVPIQNPLMRIYNMADRQRLSTGLQVIATPRETVSLGAGFEFASSDYGKTEIGLLNSLEWSANLDASVQVSKKTNVHFFLNHQQISSNQAGSQAFAPPDSFTTPDWLASENDTFNTGGVGVKHKFTKYKIDFGADYVLAVSTGEITVSGAAFPDLTTELNSLKVYANYNFKKNLTLNASVWWEKYNSDNFQLDGVTPSSVTGFPNVLTLGETSPSYDLYFLSLSVRYKF
jgi:MtrB/PioB family decaheme-associated outer membrane protein